MVSPADNAYSFWTTILRFIPSVYVNIKISQMLQYKYKNICVPAHIFDFFIRKNNY
jgi:hypothetical protein